MRRGKPAAAGERGGYAARRAGAVRPQGAVRPPRGRTALPGEARSAGAALPRRLARERARRDPAPRAQTHSVGSTIAQTKWSTASWISCASAVSSVGTRTT